jgi:hypothetical protein
MNSGLFLLMLLFLKINLIYLEKLALSLCVENHRKNLFKKNFKMNSKKFQYEP